MQSYVFECGRNDPERNENCCSRRIVCVLV